MSSPDPRQPVRRLYPLIGIAVLVFVAIGAGLIAARGPDPNARPTAEEVYNRTESPFCPGLTLAACPSSQAIELRATVARMVDQGRTNRQINGWLAANYPARILGTHSPVAWLMPAAAVLAGLIVVAAVMLRRPGPGADGDRSPLPAISPGDSARLAADIRRFADGLSE
jgi:cytochrome c-type biogenesis protein CcmH/NrfF